MKMWFILALLSCALGISAGAWALNTFGPVAVLYALPLVMIAAISALFKPKKQRVR